MSKLFTDDTGQAMLTQITRHNDLMTQLHGTLSQLTTSDKTSLVAAVNEIAAKLGVVSGLGTTANTNVVAAINEIVEFSRALKEGTGAGLHNSIWRGKYLGDHVTSEQWEAIGTGDFTDLWVGDYWIINGVTWRVADFNFWLHSGDTECTTNHIAIVPDQTLYNAQMNTSNVTTGGYLGSAMYTANLAQAKTAVNNAFGADHILSHREIDTNTVTNGVPSGYAWHDSTVELMTEQMVYGGKIFGTASNGSTVPAIYTVSKSQLALFRLCHEKTIATALADSTRMWWWLRDVVSSAYFAGVHSYGSAALDTASYSGGVRPAFAIAA